MRATYRRPSCAHQQPTCGSRSTIRAKLWYSVTAPFQATAASSPRSCKEKRLESLGVCRALGETSATAAAMDTSAACLPSDKQHIRHIVVVGAGFAGLAAARTLLDEAAGHIKVSVVESQGRVGGRAQTLHLPLSGTPVEGGATWFHGVEGHPLYDLAVKGGVVARDIRGQPELMADNSEWRMQLCRPSSSGAMSPEEDELAIQAMGRYSELVEECAEGMHPDTSIGTVLRRGFEQEVQRRRLSGRQLAAFAEGWWVREKLQRTYDGVFCTDDCGMAFATSYVELKGPHMAVPGGYERLAQMLSRGLDIRYNSRVSCIHWQQPDGKVAVECADGSVLEADAVVVTVSLGVLQAEHLSLFDPPLPAWKQEALTGLRIGIANKIYLEFDVADADCDEADSTARSSLPDGSTSSYGTCSDPHRSRLAKELGTRRPASVEQPVNQPKSSNMHLTANTIVAHATADIPAAVHHDGLLNSSNTEPTTLNSTLFSIDVHLNIIDSKSNQQDTTSAPAHQLLTTHALLWPCQPDQLGLEIPTRPQQTAADSVDGHHTQPYLSSPSSNPRGPEHMLCSTVTVPSWCRGLHSIRFAPSPEWIQPAACDGPKDGSAGNFSNRRTVSAVLWVTGEAAREIESLSNDQLAQGFSALFKAIPSIPLPHGAKLPPAVLSTNWGSNPSTRGSYSYILPGHSAEAIRSVAAPLHGHRHGSSRPVVLFAGEACSEQYQGTTHGAYLTGVASAKLILQSISPAASDGAVSDGVDGIEDSGCASSCTAVL